MNPKSGRKIQRSGECGRASSIQSLESKSEEEIGYMLEDTEEFSPYIISFSVLLQFYCATKSSLVSHQETSEYI